MVSLFSPFLFLFVSFATLLTNKDYPNLLIKKTAKWSKNTSISVFHTQKEIIRQID